MVWKKIKNKERNKNSLKTWVIYSLWEYDSHTYYASLLTEKTHRIMPCVKNMVASDWLQTYIKAAQFWRYSKYLDNYLDRSCTKCPLMNSNLLLTQTIISWWICYIDLAFFFIMRTGSCYPRLIGSWRKIINHIYSRSDQNLADDTILFLSFFPLKQK